MAKYETTDNERKHCPALGLGTKELQVNKKDFKKEVLKRCRSATHGNSIVHIIVHVVHVTLVRLRDNFKLSDSKI